MTFDQEHDVPDGHVGLTGHTVVDAQLVKVGKVTDVLSDERSRPSWAVVKTGLLSGEHFVPLAHTYMDAAGRLVVPVSKSDIKRAPRVRGDHVMTTQVQRELRDYYGVAA
jgi:hypothetical protein